MLTLFKKKKRKSKISIKKQVEGIHEEFLTASDKLLTEAEDILKESTPSEKVKLLQEVGFFGTKEVQNHVLDQLKQNKVGKTVNYISTYFKKYPGYKFITEGQVNQICKKYNLVRGRIELYEGFVPEKNLKEIVEFNKIIQEEDKQPYDGLSFNEGYRYQPMEICASLQDMDTTFMEVDTTTEKLIPDPVVLQPVHGGFLIITAWGPESEDPIITN